MQPTKQYIGIILGYGEAEVVSDRTDFDQVYKRTKRNMGRTVFKRAFV